MNYDVSFLLPQSILFVEQKNKLRAKNETESETENPAPTLRKKNLVVQLIEESRIRNKAVMSQSSRKKNKCIFYNVYFVLRRYLWCLYFIPMYIILNKLSRYIYFCISKSITSCAFLLVFKIAKSLQSMLNEKTMQKMSNGR